MYMDKIRDMLCKEMELISNRGNISMSDLSMIRDITSAIKNIDTIKAMNKDSTMPYDAEVMIRKMENDSLTLDDKSIIKKALMLLEK